MFTDEELNIVGETYIKTHIEKGFLPYVAKFYIKKNIIKDGTTLANILQKTVTKKPVTKTELIHLCFSVFKTKEIFQKFILYLPSNVQILIEKLLWVDKLTESDIESLLGEPITITDQSQYDGKKLKEEYHFFAANERFSYYSSNSQPFVLYLHPEFKKILSSYYTKPLHFYIIPLDKISPVKNKFNAAELIVQEMPRLLSYHLQDAIKYASGGKPTDATLNKLQRSCGITEFFPDQIESIGKIRTRLLAGIINGLTLNTIGTDSVEILKNNFKKQYLSLNTASFILYNIKGWGNISEQEFNPKAVQNLYELFKNLPVHKWVSIQNLMDFILFRQIDLKPVTNYVYNNRLYTEPAVVSKYGYKEKTYIGTNSNSMINIPFIKGSIFLWASLGLLEIAFDHIKDSDVNSKNHPVYNSIKYFRLTALGEYVLGVSQSYTPAQVQQQNKLQFSEDSMMIIAEGDMTVLDLLLVNYTEKAGMNRYKVTGAQFLKDCKHLKDIEHKINLFKSIVGSKLPQFWEQQFINWKLNSLKINKDSTTVIYNIPSTEKELQKLLAQDIVLKGLILKAENFNILVANNNVPKFKSRMKEFGYIIE